MSFHEESPEGCRPAPRVSFFTLGCRLNQHDTAAMRSDLERAGWRTVGSAGPNPGSAGSGWGDAADVVVVNTCTVTRRADQESRQWIRRLARERPEARIVVTGCYAQRAPEEIRSLPGVALVLGTAERESIAARLGGAAWTRLAPAGADVAGAGETPVAVAPGRARREPAAGSPLHFGRSRALLKVQDGCDAFCGYCIVPYVRGRSRSVPSAEVVAQGRRLLAAGFREIVLTGADLGAYRGGAGRPSDLTRLVETLLDLEAPEEVAGDAIARAPARGHRVRLSSIEPNKVDASLVRLLAREPRLCRHLHLPLQSGSAGILRAMRRAYVPRDYAWLVERVAASGPVAIGADVIVGFPGEGEREFAESVAFLETLPISSLHVFRYSPRPGTRAAAAGAPAPPDPAAVRERSERLRLLGEAKARAFGASLVGSVRGVVMEARRAGDGSWLGTSDLYATVALRERPAAPGGGPIDVGITSFDGEYLRGEPTCIYRPGADEVPTGR